MSDGSLGSGPADPVEILLARVLEHPESEREAALARACAEHPELIDELRARLALLAPLQKRRAQDFPEQLGDFRLVERLGGGGMGVVFRAEQISLRRAVAVKLIRPEQLWFDRARERFRREVEAVARLQHPGIVAIHTVGEERGVPYFAMELLRGRSLAAVLEALAGRS